MYSKKVLQLFFNPQFFGKMKDPDGVGQAGNPICGDTLTFFLKIEKNKIKDVSYETLGCSAAIAISEMVCQMVKGKTLDQAEKIDFKDVLKKIGKLPRSKVHCAQLGVRALREAIKDYKKKLT